MLDTQLQKWEAFRRLLSGTGPLGIAHEAPQLSSDNAGAHNVVMTYAYVLTLASRKQDSISVLDWGGGLGHYFLLAKAVLPDVDFDYYCVDTPSLCAAGRRVLPDVRFMEDEANCWQRSYDLVMAGNSLQYSPGWERVASRLAAASAGYLYLGMVPVVVAVPSFAILQRPHEYGYLTQYASWVFNRHELLAHMERQGARLMREFLMQDHAPVKGAPEQPACRGFLFRMSGAGDRGRCYDHPRVRIADP